MNEIPVTKHQTAASAALEGFLTLVSPIVFYKFASCLSSLCKSEVNGGGEVEKGFQRKHSLSCRAGKFNAALPW